MKISRVLAIQILKYTHTHSNFFFPFLVMNREYSAEDDDFVEILSEEWDDIEADKNYETFELWDNLQHLDKITANLLLKGLLEELSRDSLETHIEKLAVTYKSKWRKSLYACERMEELDMNEFVEGKADAFEDCLYLIREHKNMLASTR